MAKAVPQNLSQFVKTTDWWCGNYLKDGGSLDYDSRNALDESEADEDWQGQEYVEVKLLDNRICRYPEWQFVRVAVWGNDDLGMERDFEANQYDEALAFYNQVISLEPLTFDSLKALGMSWA
jgi:hypothetical protein